jgi:hypothetical protein
VQSSRVAGKVHRINALRVHRRQRLATQSVPIGQNLVVIEVPGVVDTSNLARP